MKLHVSSPLWNRIARGAAAFGLASSLLVTPALAQEDAPVDEATLVEEAPVEEAPAEQAFLPIRMPLPLDRLAQSNYGMNVFLWGNAATTGRDLQTLQMAGIGWQKTLFQWRAIEGRGKGQFDWSEADRVVQASNAAGIKVIARIDFQPSWARSDGAANGRPNNLQDYADFLSAFANRYRAGSPAGQVNAVQVWNEPNLQREWGAPISPQTAADYVQMLRLAYPAIKSQDPGMLVVTAGLSPTGWNDDTARPDDQYLQWLFDAGLSGNYDVLGLHGNAQAPDPLAEPGSIPGFNDGSFYFRRVEQMRAIQEANGDSARPVWLLEFGWTSDQVHEAYSWYAVSEEQKAQNILTAFQYARGNWPWMEVMTVWAMPDPNWGPDREEYWWAVSNPDGSYRPAMEMVVNAAQANLLP